MYADLKFKVEILNKRRTWWSQGAWLRAGEPHGERIKQEVLNGGVLSSSLVKEARNLGFATSQVGHNDAL